MSECALWSINVACEHCSREQLEMVLQHLFKYAIFQKEKGEKAKVEHWQLEGSLIVKASKSGLLERIAALGQPREHWDAGQIPTAQAKMIKGIDMLRLRYAAKVETRIEGPFEHEIQDLPYIPRHNQIAELRPWQQKVLDQVDIDLHDGKWRCINYLYDPYGGNGKGTLHTYVRTRRLGYLIPGYEKPDEICAAVQNMLSAARMRDPRLLIFDLPRETTKATAKAVLRAAETIKDGIVNDKRHNYKEWIFDSPCIWIFSNEFPILSGLTADRWRIWHLMRGEFTMIDVNDRRQVRELHPAIAPDSDEASSEASFQAL